MSGREYREHAPYLYRLIFTSIHIKLVVVMEHFFELQSNTLTHDSHGINSVDQSFSFALQEIAFDVL